jgi:hypothetical protein
MLAVNTDEVATPLASVVSVSVFVEFTNVPVGSEPGAVNVTDAPGVAVPFVVTVATSGTKAAPTIALCGVPLVAVITTVGAGGVLTVLVQLVKKPMDKARQIEVRMPAYALRFIATPLSAWSCCSYFVSGYGRGEPTVPAAELRVHRAL